MQNLTIIMLATSLVLIITFIIILKVFQKGWEDFKSTTQWFIYRAKEVDDSGIETILELKALLVTVQQRRKELLEAKGPMFESLPIALDYLQRCVNLVESQAVQLQNLSATVHGLIDQIDFGDAERLQMMLRAFQNKLPNGKDYEAARRKITALSFELEICN